MFIIWGWYVHTVWQSVLCLWWQSVHTLWQSVFSIVMTVCPYHMTECLTLWWQSVHTLWQCLALWGLYVRAVWQSVWHCDDSLPIPCDRVFDIMRVVCLYLVIEYLTLWSLYVHALWQCDIMRVVYPCLVTECLTVWRLHVHAFQGSVYHCEDSLSLLSSNSYHCAGCLPHFMAGRWSLLVSPLQTVWCISGYLGSSVVT